MQPNFFRFRKLPMWDLYINLGGFVLRERLTIMSLLSIWILFPKCIMFYISIFPQIIHPLLY